MGKRLRNLLAVPIITLVALTNNYDAKATMCFSSYGPENTNAIVAEQREGRSISNILAWSSITVGSMTGFALGAYVLFKGYNADKKRYKQEKENN